MRSASGSSSSFSVSSIVQYVVLAVGMYILAGPPGSSLVGGKDGGRTETMSFDKLESLVMPDRRLECEHHAYRGVHILSREPLVVYIEGFVSDEEAKHVVGVSTPHFTPSTIWNAGQEKLDITIRHSEKASLPRDQTVKCIEDRARRFQGWRPNVFVEKLWAQRYGTGGHYTYHYDWSTATKNSGRISSFMVYLEADCEGGQTHFPRLRHPAPNSTDHEWCRFIECPSSANDMEDQSLKEGVMFKAIAGNAVYWENMRPDGSGYAESWHAGLPVKTGTKIGLNIWSWLQVGYVPSVSEKEG